ncbi:hypothetical protein E1B28_007882 [Marasmius oreades]|uniref:Uncharacterized protein n=1 Tax=Marasmius oreades TaxID=181124 RepID=A0A9P7UU82_9AGAR|nr:uncharacterized protein E1B28_007882 [Marasmius oreades]KAG7094278.1 hypothetical protein E1B28_007882 [Marasmius oreades]
MPSSPTLSGFSAEQNEKLLIARQELLGSSNGEIYLASDLASHLTWRPTQDKDAGDVHVVALPDEFKGKAAGACNEGEEEDALVAVIARVSKSNTNLVHDRYYKKSSWYTETLADLKLAVALEAVTENDTLQKDFDAYQATIERLRECLPKTQDGWKRNGILIDGRGSEGTYVDKIKLRHRVFLPRKPTDPEEELFEAIDTDPFKSEYTLRGYPLRHKEARDERELMVTDKSHKLNVFGAYDTNGCIIRPSKVSESLRGAIVKVYFTIMHVPISWESKHVFSADVVSIRVIIPPSPSSTPRHSTKRKSARDPFKQDDDESPEDSSPSKKRHLTDFFGRVGARSS